jgi:hypothetical protein
MIPLPSTIVLDDPLDVLVEEPNFLEPSRHDIGRSADSILCRFSGHPGLLQTAAASFLNAIGRDIADPEMRASVERVAKAEFARRGIAGGGGWSPAIAG